MIRLLLGMTLFAVTVHADTSTLFLVGGGRTGEPILSRFAKEAGGEKARLVVIPSASESANDADAEESFLKQWKSYKMESLQMLHAKDRELATAADFALPIRKATAVWLSGGDQRRLVERYRGTPVEVELQALLKRGGIIGGTSAGMACQSEVMIEGGRDKPELGKGFGWVKGAIVDQHFFKRNRLNRLMVALSQHPGQLGIGVDESTAAIIKGDRLEVIGESYTLLIANTPLPQFAILKSGDSASLKEWKEKR